MIPFGEIKQFGLESIEIEYKLGKLSRAQFEMVRRHVEQNATYAMSSTTRHEFNGSDARREYDGPGTTHGYITVYKQRLDDTTGDDGVRCTVSLERHGDDDTSAPYTMYRVKIRDSFCLLDGAVRIDLTRIETNDPRYSDADDYVYEAEVEVDTSAPAILVYPIEYVIDRARQFALELSKIS